MSLYSFHSDRSASVIARLGRLEDALPYQTSRNVFAKKQGSALFTSVDNQASSNGAIDFTSSGVQVVGSIPPTANTPGFAATSASGAGAGTSNIHIYWDGTNASTVLVLRRAKIRGTAMDTESIRIPSGDLNITGLDPSTTYYFLPFWSPNNECMVGWVQGTVGTPQIAFTANTDSGAAAKQNYQFREPLSSGFVSFVTPAPSSSSGGTQGGGGGSPGSGCVMLGTDIEPLGDSPYRNIHVPWSKWWRIVTNKGRSLNAHPRHWIYDADKGRVPMDTVPVGGWVITDSGEEKVELAMPFTRQCTKVETQMESGHLYWANGFMSHNFPKIPK